jgi:insulysin
VIHFAVPDQAQHWRSKPFSYASHLIGHESEGSLLSLLKKQGYALALLCGLASYADGFDLFTVNVELTKKGLGT